MAGSVQSVMLVSHAAVNVCLLRKALIEELAGQGVRVHVALPDNQTEAAAADVKGMGAALHGYDMQRGAQNPVKLATASRSLGRLIGTVRPDIVHSFTHQPNIVSRLAPLHGAALVNSVTGLGSVFLAAGGKAALGRVFMHWAYKSTKARVQKVVFQNTDDQGYFVSHGLVHEDRAALIPGTGVDVRRFRPDVLSAQARKEARAKLGLAEEDVVFAMAARLVTDKGVQDFIEAGRLTVERFSQARFLLMGEPDPGNPGSLTTQDVEQLKSEQCFVLPGWRTDMDKAWALSDVAVLPSRREGLPVTMQEALACGLPVITTDAPGCRDIAGNVADGEEGHAVLVPVGDVNSLAEAMRSLAASPQKRRDMGDAGRLYAERNFDGGKLARQMIALYAQIT